MVVGIDEVEDFTKDTSFHLSLPYIARYLISAHEGPFGLGESPENGIVAALVLVLKTCDQYLVTIISPYISIYLLQRFTATMNSYLDSVVPADDGEVVKKRVRDRDSEDEGRPTKRPRASTNALFTPLPEGHQEDINEPPKPEDDVGKYDHARLEQGLRYIQGAEERKITPRTEWLLRFQKDAYKIALEGEAPTEASIAVVQALDKTYYSNAFYFKPRLPDEHDHLMNYVKLQRLELLANYGNYLGQEGSLFRAGFKAAASGAQSGNFEVRDASVLISGPRTWVEIADELKGSDLSGLRKNIHSSCDALGFDSGHMLWLIEEWATRNRMFHNNIRQHISDCDWHEVAKLLYRDLKELPNVAPDIDTAAKYKTVLLNIRDHYFDVLDPDHYRHWLPSEEAKRLIMEQIAKEKK